MAWIKDSASREGQIGNSDKGGYIVVTLRNNIPGVPIEEQAREILRYCKTRTGGTSAATFLASVKQEAKAMLAHLNRDRTPVDITDQVDLT